MSDHRFHFRLLAVVAIGSSLVGGACSDSLSVLPPGGGSGGDGASAGSSSNGGAAGSGDMGGSAAMGGSGDQGGSSGAGSSGGAAGSGAAGSSAGTSSTGGTGDDLPDAGIPDATDGGPVGDSGAPAVAFELIDFAGASTGSEAKAVETWDLREKFTFNVTGSHVSSATVEVVNSQAQLTFAVDDPDPLGTTNVFQFVKIPAATGNGDNWGGWAHIIFGLGNALPEDLVLALPQWDNGNQVMVPGTKVIQVDVYYDETVDPDFDWATMLALEDNGAPDIWNSVAAQGYNVNLALVNYADHANVGGAQDSGGYYISYSAYLTQPNTWQTLTFTAVDEGRVANFYAALSSQITGVDIKPAGGYDDEDSNPVYLRNLRIVDAP